MHIEHFVFLSWFPASLESHEQDGEKLSRVTASREATASGDPAMAFRTLPCRRRRSSSAPAKSPAAPIAAGLTNERTRIPHSPHETRRASAPCAEKSSADAELLDQILVARFVGTTQIIEQLTALADKLEQPTTRMVVLDVGFEMLSEIIDALGQDRHLHFRRPGISGLLGIRLYYFGLAAGGHRHRSSFLTHGSAQQAGEVKHTLGDDFATIQFGQSQQSARYRDIDCAAEIGCVPSAQQNGLASLKPCRVCSADGQRRDVVQRGLNGHQSIREARLAGRGSMA